VFLQSSEHRPYLRLKKELGIIVGNKGKTRLVSFERELKLFAIEVTPNQNKKKNTTERGDALLL